MAISYSGQLTHLRPIFSIVSVYSCWSRRSLHVLVVTRIMSGCFLAFTVYVQLDPDLLGDLLHQAIHHVPK